MGYFLVAILLFVVGAIVIYYLYNSQVDNNASNDSNDDVATAHGNVHTNSTKNVKSESSTQFIHGVSSLLQERIENMEHSKMDTSSNVSHEQNARLISAISHSGEPDVYGNEIVLSDKEKENFVRLFKQTHFAKIAPYIKTISKDGKLRIDHALLFQIVSDFNPVILPDGSIRITNLLSVEENMLLAINHKVPLFIFNAERNDIRRLDNETLQQLIVDESTLVDNEKYESLKKNYEILKSNMKPLATENERLNLSLNQIQSIVKNSSSATLRSLYIAFMVQPLIDQFQVDNAMDLLLNTKIYSLTESKGKTYAYMDVDQMHVLSNRFKELFNIEIFEHTLRSHTLYFMDERDAKKPFYKAVCVRLDVTTTRLFTIDALTMLLEPDDPDSAKVFNDHIASIKPAEQILPISQYLNNMDAA